MINILRRTDCSGFNPIEDKVSVQNYWREISVVIIVCLVCGVTLYFMR
jgi:hypothetical protein